MLHIQGYLWGKTTWEDNQSVDEMTTKEIVFLAPEIYSSYASPSAQTTTIVLPPQFNPTVGIAEPQVKPYGIRRRQGETFDVSPLR
jgi:hypothetical protein